MFISLFTCLITIFWASALGKANTGIMQLLAELINIDLLSFFSRLICFQFLLANVTKGSTNDIPLRFNYFD